METQIKASLISLLAGIKRADGQVIAEEMARLDDFTDRGGTALHPQLLHFLQNRSYAKAVLWLGGGKRHPGWRVRGSGGERPGMNKGDKVTTDGGKDLGQNPFAALSAGGLPAAKLRESGVTAPAKSGLGDVSQGKLASGGRSGSPTKNRGRVDILRETGGRGGKTVTVVSGFVGIGLPEKEQLAKKIRGACGCGGTVKDGQIEIQGDQRETVARILTEAGFRPVFAGG